MSPPITPSQRRWTNRAVVREVDPYRARRLWGAIVAILLAAAPFAAYMLEKNECVGLSYEAGALKIEREQLVEQQRRLRVRRAALVDLDAIEMWAVDRYGLQRPSHQEVVVVKEAGTDPVSLAALETGSR